MSERWVAVSFVEGEARTMNAMVLVLFWIFFLHSRIRITDGKKERRVVKSRVANF